METRLWTSCPNYAAKSGDCGALPRSARVGYAGGNRSGIIFFNDEETEDGGLVFEGRTDGGVHNAGAQLSFDQYDQDQVLYVTYDDANGQRVMGLNVVDRADTAGA